MNSTQLNRSKAKVALGEARVSELQVANYFHETLKFPNSSFRLRPKRIGSVQ